MHAEQGRTCTGKTTELEAAKAVGANDVLDILIDAGLRGVSIDSARINAVIDRHREQFTQKDLQLIGGTALKASEPEALAGFVDDLQLLSKHSFSRSENATTAAATCENRSELDQIVGFCGQMARLRQGKMSVAEVKEAIRDPEKGKVYFEVHTAGGTADPIYLDEKNKIRQDIRQGAAVVLVDFKKDNIRDVTLRVYENKFPLGYEKVEVELRGGEVTVSGSVGGRSVIFLSDHIAYDNQIVDGVRTGGYRSLVKYQGQLTKCWPEGWKSLNRIVNSVTSYLSRHGLDDYADFRLNGDIRP